MRVDIHRLDEEKMALARAGEYQPSSTLINTYQPSSTLINFINPINLINPINPIYVSQRSFGFQPSEISRK